jgi:hypothetical protein
MSKLQVHARWNACTIVNWSVLSAMGLARFSLCEGPFVSGRIQPDKPLISSREHIVRVLVHIRIPDRLSRTGACSDGGR